MCKLELAWHLGVVVWQTNKVGEQPERPRSRGRAKKEKRKRDKHDKRRQAEPQFNTTSRLFDTGIRSEYSFARALAKVEQGVDFSCWPSCC